MAQIGRRAVAVVGERLHHHGHAGGTVALVGDALVIVLFAALGLFDDALDVVVGDVHALGLGNEVPQLGIDVGVAAARLYAHGHLTADLCEDLGALAVRLFLFPLDIIPFAVP